MFYIFFIIIISSLLSYLIYRISKLERNIKPNKKYGIFITGCDSGIGYSIALYCQNLGMSVFAGCFNLKSEGSSHLQKLENVFLIPLDVTDLKSIHNAFAKVKNILDQNAHIDLITLVNNAGIMVFGEFPWQTEKLIQQQVEVNLIGAMNTTKIFLPYIKKNKGRIVNICSHCSLEALPGLSVYAASKAGLIAWSNALRIELYKFEVTVISFIPGSFPLETNILSKQQHYTEEMKIQMNKNEWNLYKSYFQEYYSYLNHLSGPKFLKKIEDPLFYSSLANILLSNQPKSHYCNSPFRYLIYHFLFKITPIFIHDWLILKFVNMPRWKN